MVAVQSVVPHRSIGIVLTHLPIILIASMFLLSSGLGGHRITLEPLIPATMAALSVTLLAIALYARVRQSPKLAEATFYAGLWFAFPIAGTKLTYLAILLGAPLQDQTFTRLDAAIGFDWTAWALFVEAHPLLLQVQEFAYASHSWQPILTIAVLAAWGPAGRNKELLTNVLLALLIVTAVSAWRRRSARPMPTASRRCRAGSLCSCGTASPTCYRASASSASRPFTLYLRCCSRRRIAACGPFSRCCY